MTSEGGGKAERGRRSVKGALAVLAVLVVVAAVYGATRLSARRESAEPSALALAADTLVVPAGWSQAFPDATTENPARLVKGWRGPGSVDAACTEWRESFRSWIGDVNTNSVTGEVVPGQSCTYAGPKQGLSATLIVAAYGTDDPQATLTLSEE